HVQINDACVTLIDTSSVLYPYWSSWRRRIGHGADHQRQYLRRCRSPRFSRDAGGRPLRAQIDGLRQDHLPHPPPFLDPPRQEIHRFLDTLRFRERDVAAGRFLPDLPHACRRSDVARAENQIRPAIGALADLIDPAWRAGCARAIGVALPYPEGSRRAGIRR